MMKKLCTFAFRAGLGLAAFLGVSAAANAQSLSSFSITGAFSDVSITSSNGLVYNVAVGSNPSFVYAGNTYVVTDIIGFWVLSETSDFTASNVDFNSLAGTWKEKNNNSGAGAIAGWRASNANAGLTPGESETFNFNSLSPTSEVDAIGLHVRVEGSFPGGGGNTGHIRFGPVPEPATLAVLGVGFVALLRRSKSL